VLHATASIASKSNLILAQSVRSYPACLQTVLPEFSLGTNLIPSIEPFKQFHYSILAVIGALVFLEFEILSHEVKLTKAPGVRTGEIIKPESRRREIVFVLH
jgi:hypothetical protein